MGLFFKSGIDKGFEKDLARMNKKLNSFNTNVETTGSGVSKAFNKMGVAAAGVVSTLAIGAAGKELLTFSQDLETALTEVSTISSAVTDDFEGYKDAILSLSTTSASSAKTLTDAYYDIVSAGYDGAQGLELLAAAEKASTAGFVEVSTAADGLTTVLNAWGKSAEEATSVSDIFFKTVEKGKTTFPELGNNIAQVAPIAASMGVSFEEVSGAVATLTKSGTPTAQAFTQIRASLLAVNSELGDGWAQTMTYQEALEAVRERAGGSTNELKNMLGRVEAVNAVLGLTGKNAETAAEDLDAMNNAMGASTIAAEKVTATTAQQIAILKNNILAALEPLGAKGSSLIANLAEGLNKAFQSGDIEKYAKILLQLTKAFGAYKVAVIAHNQVKKLQRNLILSNIKAMKLAKATGKQVSGVNILMAKSIKGVTRAMSANPIGLLVAGLTMALPLIKNVASALQSTAGRAEKLAKKIEESFQEESAGLTVLQDQLNDSNISYDEKKDLINKLNTEYGDYLPALLTEKSTQEEINAAITEANTNLREQIKLRALQSQAVESSKKIIKLEKKLTPQVRATAALPVVGAIVQTMLTDLANERALYEKILDDISNINKKKVETKTKPVAPPKPAGGGGSGVIPPVDPEELRKQLKKQLEIENQERINALIKNAGASEEAQKKLQTKLIQNEIKYLQEKRKLSTDALEKLKIDEQILSAKFAITSANNEAAVSAAAKKAAQAKEIKSLQTQYATYLQKREALLLDSEAKIEKLKAANEDGKYSANIQLIKDETNAALRELDILFVNASSDLGKLFADTKDKSLAEIKNLITETEKLLSSLTGGTAFDGENFFNISEEDFKKLKASPEEIERIRAALDRLRESSKDTSNAFQKIGEGFGEIKTSESTKEFGQGMEKMQEGMGGIGDGAKFMSDSLISLSEATGEESLAMAAEYVQGLTDIFGAVQEGAAAGAAIAGPVGAAIGGVVGAMKGIADISAKTRKENEALGAEMIATNEAITVSVEEYSRSLDNISKQYSNIYGESGFAQGFEATSKSIRVATVQLDSYLEQLESVATKTKEGGWFRGDTYTRILDLYPQLINEQGRLNEAVAEGVLATNILGESEKAVLEGALSAQRTLQDSYEAMGDYLSSIFGGVADEVSMAFQNMYESGADAMANLEIAFSDMIEQFTREAIQFAFLQPYLDQLNKTTKELGKQYAGGTLTSDELQEDIIGALGGFYDSLNEIQPEILRAYENADALAEEKGFESAFDPNAAAESSSGGEVRRAITEETGSSLVGRAGAIMLSNQELLNNSNDLVDYASKNLVTLNKIKENTDHLPEIASGIKKMSENLV